MEPTRWVCRDDEDCERPCVSLDYEGGSTPPKSCHYDGFSRVEWTLFTEEDEMELDKLEEEV